MRNKLAIRQATDTNGAYIKRLEIVKCPFVVTPTNPAATLAAGGSLTLSTTYYYKITAVGVNGETIGSAEVNATPSGGNRTINLTWDLQSDWGLAHEYRVYRSTTSGVYTSGFFRASTNSFSDTGAKTLETGTIPSSQAFNSVQKDYIFYDNINTITTTLMPEYSLNGELIPVATKLTLHNKKGCVVFECELQDVINQGTWNLGTAAACEQAKLDINSWITSPY